MTDPFALEPVVQNLAEVDLVEQAHAYMAASKAPNTLRGYRAGWTDFTCWCATRGKVSLPAEPATVAIYLADLAARAKPATIRHRLSAISQAHQAAGFEPPTRSAPVRAVWSGIRRTHGTAQVGKAALLTADVRTLLAAMDGGLLAVRDRALLLLGFAGAFRRSELVALDVADLAFVPDGMIAVVRRVKTDQDGAGHKKAIPFGRHPGTCPVLATRTWLEAGAIEAGAVFRSVNRHGHVLPGRLSDKAVALVVKRRALAAGLDPAGLGGHSLRAGLATSAAIAGVSERSIMNQTGHRSVAMVRRYVRDANLFRDNAAGGVGL